MNCPKCGNEVVPGNNFCIICGAALAGAAAQPVAQPADQAATTQPAPAQPEHQQYAPPSQPAPQQASAPQQVAAPQQASAPQQAATPQQPAPQPYTQPYTQPQSNPAQTQYQTQYQNQYQTQYQNQHPNQQYAQQAPAGERTGNATVILVFMIISCVVQGFFLIPLAWCIPMTIHANNCMKRGIKMDVGFKVCVLLFQNMIAGIIMLCDEKC